MSWLNAFASRSGHSLVEKPIKDWWEIWVTKLVYLSSCLCVKTVRADFGVGFWCRTLVSHCESVSCDNRCWRFGLRCLRLTDFVRHCRHCDLLFISYERRQAPSCCVVQQHRDSVLQPRLGFWRVKASCCCRNMSGRVLRLFAVCMNSISDGRRKDMGGLVRKLAQNAMKVLKTDSTPDLTVMLWVCFCFEHFLCIKLKILVGISTFRGELYVLYQSQRRQKCG